MGKLSQSTNWDIWLSVHPALGISLMDHLYNRLDGAYPNRWRAAFANDPKAIQNWRETWAEAFVKDRLTPNDIKRGLVNARKMYDWPPSYKEFYAACKTYQAPAQEKLLALPKYLTEQDKEKGREFLAGIRALLRKGAQ